MLRFPLSFYWLSGVKWIRMQDVKPQTLVETFDQANYNSIPKYDVALITLLTYPVSTCTAERSFRGMKRLQTPLWRTMTDERLMSSLAILHIHKHKDVIYIYWWHYNGVCPSEEYTSRPLLVTSLMALLLTGILCNLWNQCLYGWKKRLRLEGVRGEGGCILKSVIAKGGGGSTIFICNYLGGG